MSEKKYSFNIAPLGEKYVMLARYWVDSEDGAKEVKSVSVVKDTIEEAFEEQQKLAELWQ